MSLPIESPFLVSPAERISMPRKHVIHYVSETLGFSIWQMVKL